VAPKDIGQQLDAVPGRHVRQAYQPRMLRAAEDFTARNLFFFE
jgi:hypothetical protein